ncbi:hypothetical protein SAMN05414139_01535 [Burkholderia sp. D7]|nr:hypothetical protein SAMN05414139_01535 [Burkholderia sp. D7]
MLVFAHVLLWLVAGLGMICARVLRAPSGADAPDTHDPSTRQGFDTTRKAMVNPSLTRAIPALSLDKTHYASA